MDVSGNNLENVIDRILFSARDLRSKLEAVKDLSPNGDLENIQDEYRHSRRVQELERQNAELRQALEDHQYGLEFIMNKYRSQIEELIKLNKLEKNITPSSTLGLKRNNSID